jgi:hypothetical protein
MAKLGERDVKLSLGVRGIACRIRTKELEEDIVSETVNEVLAPN